MACTWDVNIWFVVQVTMNHAAFSTLKKQLFSQRRMPASCKVPQATGKMDGRHSTF